MPVNGLDEFNREIEAWVQDRVPAEVRALATEIGLRALARIVFKTPVDVGRARANWQTTVGAPAQGVVTEPDPEGDRAIRNGIAVIESAPPFSIVWITNNVEYILVLEEGGYLPPNPENSPEANKKRAASRSKAKRKAVADKHGDEGAPLVQDGRSLQAPQGMVAITVEELRGLLR